MSKDTKVWRAMIIEDGPQNRMHLEKLLAELCPNVEVIGTSGEVEEGIQMVNDLMPNLLFLDVEIDGGTGFDVLNAVQFRDFALILTTAYNDYAMDAIKFNAVDYLLKPISGDDLEEAIKKTTAAHQKWASTALNSEKSEKSGKRVYTKIALPTFEGIDFIDIDQIIHCEANRSYSNFYLSNKEKVLVSKSLSEFEYLTNSKFFMRVHRSHMVNLKHVKKYIKGKGGYLVMSDGSSVDVAAKRKDQLLEKMATI